MKDNNLAVLFSCYIDITVVERCLISIKVCMLLAIFLSRPDVSTRVMSFLSFFDGGCQREKGERNR